MSYHSFDSSVKSLDSGSDSSSSDGQDSPTEDLPDPFVETMMKETNDLVVDYIGFRLRSKFRQSLLRGLPREILVPPCQPSVRATNLRNLAMNLEGQNEPLFQQICAKVDLSEFEAERNFQLIADEIFANEINWGRIVSLITFTGVVAHHFVKQERPAMVSEIIQWLLQFIRVHIITWIIKKGGWVCELFPFTTKITLFSVVKCASSMSIFKFSSWQYIC